jgi:FKBP-type peptidyl-prolyl cis-trans isomerase
MLTSTCESDGKAIVNHETVNVSIIHVMSKKQLRLERKAARKMGQEPQYGSPTITNTNVAAAAVITATTPPSLVTKVIQRSDKKIHRKSSQEIVKFKTNVESHRHDKSSKQRERNNLPNEKIVVSSQRNQHNKKNKRMNNDIECKQHVTKIMNKDINKVQTAITKSQLETRDSTILQDLFHGTSTMDSTNTTHGNGLRQRRWGVQYRDVVIGRGKVVDEKSTIYVSYRMTSDKWKGIVLDSSSRFQVTLGKGSVIQGWDIGIPGMRVGGKRTIVVPPKAGYGSKDVGAGPGATLYFDISVLSCL